MSTAATTFIVSKFEDDIYRQVILFSEVQKFHIYKC